MSRVGPNSSSLKKAQSFSDLNGNFVRQSSTSSLNSSKLQPLKKYNSATFAISNSLDNSDSPQYPAKHRRTRSLDQDGSVAVRSSLKRGNSVKGKGMMKKKVSFSQPIAFDDEPQMVYSTDDDSLVQEDVYKTKHEIRVEKLKQKRLNKNKNSNMSMNICTIC